MDKSRYLQLAKQMIGLTRCAVNGEKPSAELLDMTAQDELFSVCQSHILTACTTYALESADIRLPVFTEAKEKAIRKNILLDSDRKKILSRLESAGIWYLPLKGVLLKDWYPKLGMRQMSDNDILFDAKHRSEVREIMESLGFTCEHFGTGYNDAYAKPPVCYFEMHSSLFSEEKRPIFFAYYQYAENHLLKDDESEYGRHFSNEDFYIYNTVHAYKHFSGGGIGVRALLDTYVFLRRFNESLNWDYMNKEFDVLGIREYEQNSRSLALKLFSGQPLTESEDELLQYYILSGTYGTVTHAIENRIKQTDGSKLRYVFKRVFPPMDDVQKHYPFFYRHKILLPVLWIYRPVRGIFCSRTKLLTEAKLLFRKGEEKK